MKVILDGLSEDNHENYPLDKPDLIPRKAVWDMYVARIRWLWCDRRV